MPCSSMATRPLHEGERCWDAWGSSGPTTGSSTRPACAVAILNDARELALFLTEHILAKVVRALTALATRTIASLTVLTRAGRC